MRISASVTLLQLSLAMPISVTTLCAQVELPVNAKMDIYRAGGYNDGSDGTAPAIYSFPAQAVQTLTFSSVSGSWTCGQGNLGYGADGTSVSPCYPNANIANPVGTFSGYSLTDFTGAMAGMFLEDTLPPSAPAPLRFYANDDSQGGIQTDFTSLSPKIGQVFFIGDGLAGTGIGSVQTFKVPATATHLYLGYVKSCSAAGNAAPGCYSTNTGSLTAIFSLQEHVLGWVEPTLSSAPSARFGVGMAYDPSTHSTVLFGGGNARLPGVVYGDTWIWRNGWRQLSPASSPPARSDAGMAHDPITGTVLLFGGQNAAGVVFGDTWTWNGVTWTQLFPPVSPPARASSGGIVYDAASETVLVFGGAGDANDQYGAPVFGDTWEWNGTTKTWTQQFPASGPSPRGAPLAYDPIAKRAVLFGGNNGGGNCCSVFYGDTWTWDGLTWTQQSPATSPSARGSQMTYDDGIGQVVLFGGTAAPPQGLNDTWAWNGKTWKQLTATQTTGLWGAGMDFDASSGGLLLFGGELTGDIVTGNTWLFVPVAVQ